jgi:hypothetical protein
MALSLLPRKAEIDLARAAGSSPAGCGGVASDCWTGSSEPHTLSIHTTGSVIATTVPQRGSR